MASKLGNLLSATRKAKGFGLREFAKLVGKSPAFISMLENEESPPTVKEETLVEIARVLSLDVNDLLGLAGKVPDAALPDSGLDVALFRMVKDLSPEEKRQLFQKLEEKG